MTTSHPVFPPFSREDAAERVRVELISYGDTPEQVIEIYQPEKNSSSTLLLLHGGYWRNLFDAEHMRPLGVALAEAGWQVAIPEFRRVAGQPDLTLIDLRNALSHISGPLTLIGYSSGGHLALLLAAENVSVEKVIALAPVTDLIASQERGLGRDAVREWLGCDAIDRPDLDPARQPSPEIPTIFIHGELDERVPLDLTESYCEKARQEGRPIELIKLAGTSHFQMMEIPSETYSAILQSLIE